jgi:dipeptidyl aminopeptidase/acylaminoacyl peptidase
MRPSPIRAVRLVVTALVFGCALAAQGLTPQQLMRLRTVSAVAPSPDGRWLAYAVMRERGLEEAAGPALSDLLVMPLDGSAAARRVASAAAFAWQPQTSVLSWVARREGDPAPQLHGIDVSGGDEKRLTTAPNGIAAFQWRPDGKAIAYTALDPASELRAANEKLGFRQQVVDEDWRHVSLWQWEIATAQATRLTSGMTVQAFTWSPTSTHLAIAASPRNLTDDAYVFTRLYEVALDGPRTTKLAENPGKLGGGAWSPSGRHFAYIGAADRNDPHAGMLSVVERGGREPVAIDHALKGAVTHVEWQNEERLLAMVSFGVRSALVPVAPAEARFLRHEAKTLPCAASSFARFRDDGRIALAGSTGAHPSEAFVVDETGAARRLTRSNPELDGVALGKQELVLVRARDGLAIEGLRILPTTHRDGERHPLVIVAHGGPEAHYQDGWLTRYSEPGQVLAGRGFVVWYPNYRASTGYGVAFAKADHGDPMGREFEDHLDAIAQFEREGLIDPARVGIVGGSYGGYTAAWAATRHSERFAAAVSFVPFVDLRTKWLTTDIQNEFYLVHYQEKWPHEQAGFLADRSPLSWAPQCRTPLLLCGGDADPRVHPSQPFMLYRAVQAATDTPCRYVRYPGEGHGNRSNVYRYDLLLRGVQWLEHYLVADGRTRELPPLDLEYPRY